MRKYPRKVPILKTWRIKRCRDSTQNCECERRALFAVVDSVLVIPPSGSALGSGGAIERI